MVAEKKLQIGFLYNFAGKDVQIVFHDERIRLYWVEIVPNIIYYASADSKVRL